MARFWQHRPAGAGVERGCDPGSCRSRRFAHRERTLALLNAAISDALASVMETKYHYRFWRPETAIHAGDADGNVFTRGDAGFAPLIVAPCFPAGSARTSAAGAAREVLETLYGKRLRFVRLTHAALPDVTLQSFVPPDRRGHRRCPHLRRHPLSFRAGSRREDGPGEIRYMCPQYAAAFAATVSIHESVQAQRAGRIGQPQTGRGRAPQATGGEVLVGIRAGSLNFHDDMVGRERSRPATASCRSPMALEKWSLSATASTS